MTFMRTKKTNESFWSGCFEENNLFVDGFGSCGEHGATINRIPSNLDGFNV